MTERRAKGRRQWKLRVGFPLIDCDGITVTTNRRRMPDRRLDNIALEERLMLFSEMPTPTPDRY